LEFQTADSHQATGHLCTHEMHSPALQLLSRVAEGLLGGIPASSQLGRQRVNEVLTSVFPASTGATEMSLSTDVQPNGLMGPAPVWVSGLVAPAPTGHSGIVRGGRARTQPSW
jgi:hypothetical protein